MLHQNTFSEVANSYCIGKMECLYSPCFPQTLTSEILFHNYRLMTHFIPVQNRRFFCLAHCLLEMLLGRASMKELSVLVLFLVS